jgi:integrase
MGLFTRRIRMSRSTPTTAARQTVRIPKLCHHKRAGLAYVTLGGRQRYLGRWDPITDRPTKAAQSKFHKLMGEHLAAAGAGDGTEHCETIAEMCAAFVAFAHAKYNGSSQMDLVRSAIQCLLVGYAADPPGAFNTLQLLACRQRLLGRDLNRHVINRTIRQIKRIFRWAGTYQRIDPMISHRLECVEGLSWGEGGRESVERMPALWPQVQAVEDLVARQVWAMIQLQWVTGMRSQNVCEISTGRIEMGDKDVWFYTPVSDKARRRRKRGEKLVIALGPRAQEILGPWLRFDVNEFLFSPAEAEAEHRDRRRAHRKTPLWPSHLARYGRQRRRRSLQAPGDCYTSGTYRRAIRRACEQLYPLPATLARRKGEKPTAWRTRLAGSEAGAEDLDAFIQRFWWTPHQLRHAFATRAGDVFDGELDTVAAALGHKHVDTTLLYAHLNKNKAAKVARRIG